MQLVEFLVRRINPHFSGGPIWRAKNNTQTLPMVAAIGIFVWVAAQSSSAPVAVLTIVLAVALMAIIIVSRVAGATASQLWTRLLAVVAAIRSAAYISAPMLSRDIIVPPVGGDPTPHAGAPPDHDRAPRPHLVTAARPCSAGRRGAGHACPSRHPVAHRHTATCGLNLTMR